MLGKCSDTPSYHMVGPVVHHFMLIVVSQMVTTPLPYGKLT